MTNHRSPGFMNSQRMPSWMAEGAHKKHIPKSSNTNEFVVKTSATTSSGTFPQSYCLWGLPLLPFMFGPVALAISRPPTEQTKNGTGQHLWPRDFISVGIRRSGRPLEHSVKGHHGWMGWIGHSNAWYFSVMRPPMNFRLKHLYRFF